MKRAISLCFPQKTLVIGEFHAIIGKSIKTHEIQYI